MVLFVAAAIRWVMAMMSWANFTTFTENRDCSDDHADTDSASPGSVAHDDFRLWEAEFA
jgi:hypothetical protein